MKELIQIQAELKAPKNQRNNFGKYNYRSCEDILEAVKPLLKKYDCELTISDEIKEVGALVYVEATASFTKDKISTTVKAQAGIDPNRKGMDIAQSFGSSSSYARKYALNGLFLIDDTKDSDSPQMKVEQEERQKESKPTMPDSALPKAIEAIKAKTATVSQIQQKYTLTDSQLKQLNNA